jgi:hypothetical protein
MITQLGTLDPQHLGVIARTSSMQYKDAKTGAAQIARELAVDYLLEGSVRRSGQRVRVTAQLIQASDQTHLWAADFDRCPEARKRPRPRHLLQDRTNPFPFGPRPSHRRPSPQRRGLRSLPSWSP